jgi:hypothetical protein
LSIGWREVEVLLIKELPEFADVVREHQEYEPDGSMSYLLVGQLFDFVVDSFKSASIELAREIGHRTYSLVDRALTEGDEYIQTCFAIQMIEPVSTDEGHLHYPNLESLMGPAARRELAHMREWWRRYNAMFSTVSAVNAEVGCDVLTGIGMGGVGLGRLDDASVVADRTLWTELPKQTRARVFRSLRERWLVIRGLPNATQDSGLRITGTREQDFALLAADNKTE